MRTDEKMKRALTKLSAVLVLVLAFVASAAAQSTTPGPHDQDGNSVRDLGATLEKITDAASDMIPTFVRTVEAPLGPYFDFLAWYLAWLIMIVFMLKVFRGAAANDPEDIFWAFARVAVCFALLSYCGDTNGDGVRGDLINRLGAIGNSIAYGDGRCDDCQSHLQRTLRERQVAFGNAYNRFLDNRFMYQIDNKDRLVQYPDDTDRGYQLMAAIYSGSHSPEDINKKFDPNSWSMGNLFQFLNFGRGLVEFGDLFLLILNGFLVASIRLAAPFMAAIAIDREYAKRVSVPYAWGVFTVTIVMPIVSQVIRLFAYTIATIPMGLGGANNPFFKYDPSTAKVIALGNPEYSIIIAALVMTICGLSMFASPYISYKFGQGGVFEAITGVVSGWMGGIISTGVSTYSVAMASAINNQAERQTANQGAVADGVTAKSALESSNRSAAGAMSNSIALSRSSQQAEVGGAQVSAWSAQARAEAQQEKLQTEQLAGVQAGDIERDAKLGSAAVTAQSQLDDAWINNSSALGSVLGVLDNVDRAIGAGGGSSGGVFSPNDPSNQTNFGDALRGSSDSAIAGISAAHADGRGYRPLDRTSGSSYYDALYDKAGRDNNVDPNLLMEIGRQETGGFQSSIINGRQKSPAGASGIAQMMPDTAQQYGLKVGGGVDQRNDPALAIPAQGRMVKDLLQKHDGNPLLAAAAYNSGHNAPSYGPKSAANRMMPGNPESFRETKGYVANVGSRLGLGDRAVYRSPQGVQALLAQTGGNSRGFSRAKRDAFIGVENASREAEAGGAADRLKASATINAGRTYTDREIAIASHEAGARSRIAVVAGGQREGAARQMYRDSVAANTISYQGQKGNPKAPAGTPENLGAIEIRRQAAVEAARQRAMAQVVSGVGSTIASQVQGVFTQFNRY